MKRSVGLTTFRRASRSCGDRQRRGYAGRRDPAGRRLDARCPARLPAPSSRCLPPLRLARPCGNRGVPAVLVLLLSPAGPAERFADRVHDLHWAVRVLGCLLVAARALPVAVAAGSQCSLGCSFRRSRLFPRLVLPPGRPSALLRVHPGEHGVAAVPSVATELHARQQAGAGVLAHSPLRHVQQLRDFARVEEPIGHFRPPTGTKRRYKVRRTFAQFAQRSRLRGCPQLPPSRCSSRPSAQLSRLWWVSTISATASS